MDTTLTNRVTVTLPAPALEPVAEHLRRCTSGALELIDEETLAYGGSRARLAEGQVRVVTYVGEEALPALFRGLRDLIRRLRRDGLLRGPTEIDLDADQGEWARPPRVVRVARRFCIARPWVGYRPAPGEIFLPLDAAGAFGDGRHPSTALVLTLLDRLASDGLAPARILDVGCGSGVLSLAAARLWPDTRIVAVDVDPEAVRVCRRNVARLELESRVEVSTGDVAERRDRFPLLLANLTAGTLWRLAPALGRLVEVGGHAVVAGFVATALDRVERTLLGYHMFAVDAEEMEGWHALTLRRRARP